MNDVSTTIGRMMEANRVSSLQWKIVFLCALVMVLDGFDNVSIGFLIPYIAKDWGTSMAGITLVFTMGSIGSAIGYIGGGPLADRIGRRPTLIISTLGFGVLSILCAVVRDVNDLIILRTLVSLALGAAIPNILALAVEYAPSRFRGGLVAAMFTVSAAGMTLVGATTAILAPAVGWKGVFLIGGGLPVLVGLYLIAALPESIEFLVIKGRTEAATVLLRRIVPRLSDNWHVGLGKVSAKEPLVRLFQEGRAPMTLLIWLVFAMTQGVIILLNAFMPTMFKTGGMPIAMAVQAATSYQFGAVFGGVVSSAYLVGRSRARVLMYLCLAEVGAMIFLALVGFGMVSTGLAMTLSALTGMCIAACLTGMNGINAISYPTEMRGTAVGAVSSVGRVCGIGGPIAAGILMASGLPIAWVFVACAMPLVLGAVAIFALRGLHAESGAEPAVAPAQ
jgi:AAHS family 4-hydroxybenzoate transporter-like MFS transporter